MEALDTVKFYVNRCWLFFMFSLPPPKLEGSEGEKGKSGKQIPVEILLCGRKGCSEGHVEGSMAPGHRSKVQPGLSQLLHSRQESNPLFIAFPTPVRLLGFWLVGKEEQTAELLREGTGAPRREEKGKKRQPGREPQHRPSDELE